MLLTKINKDKKKKKSSHLTDACEHTHTHVYYISMCCDQLIGGHDGMFYIYLIALK